MSLTTKLLLMTVEALVLLHYVVTRVLKREDEDWSPSSEPEVKERRASSGHSSASRTTREVRGLRSDFAHALIVRGWNEYVRARMGPHRAVTDVGFYLSEYEQGCIFAATVDGQKLSYKASWELAHHVSRGPGRFEEALRDWCMEHMKAAVTAFEKRLVAERLGETA